MQVPFSDATNIFRESAGVMENRQQNALIVALYLIKSCTVALRHLGLWRELSGWCKLPVSVCPESLHMSRAPSTFQLRLLLIPPSSSSSAQLSVRVRVSTSPKQLQLDSTLCRLDLLLQRLLPPAVDCFVSSCGVGALQGALEGVLTKWVNSHLWSLLPRAHMIAL